MWELPQEDTFSLGAVAQTQRYDLLLIVQNFLQRTIQAEMGPREVSPFLWLEVFRSLTSFCQRAFVTKYRGDKVQTQCFFRIFNCVLGGSLLDISQYGFHYKLFLFVSCVFGSIVNCNP